MKFFAIWLCIAIGSVFGELQRRKFGKEKLEVTTDVNKARSPISVDDGKSPYSSDEGLRGKYAQDNSFDQIAANTKDADSVENETPRNLSPIIETSTVKPSSSKAIKKNLEIMYLGKPEKPFKELREITRRNRTESKPLKEISVNFLKMLLMSTDALSHKETNLESNSRKFLRKKRMAEVEDPTNLVESYKMYRKVREKLPAQLRTKTRKTDTAEEQLLKSYATSNGDTSNLIADYNSAKSAEREQLKVDASGSGATEVIDNYKALRKGKPWNYIKLRGKLQGLFGKPSPSLTEYETLKQDEVASIDSFLGGSSNTESGKATNVQSPQEKEKPTEDWAVKSEDTNVTDAWYQPTAYGPDDNAEKDAKMFDHDVEDNLDRDYEGNDYTWETYDYSNECQKVLGHHLSQDIIIPMARSNIAENALLKESAAVGKFLYAYLDIYYEWRRKEIEALKAYLAKKPEKLRKRILFIYQHDRKGKPWFLVRVYCRGFFAGNVPQQAVDKYLAVKKEELYTEEYLNGSMKIGEVPKEGLNAKLKAFEKATSQAKSEKPYRKLKAAVAEIARSKEDEKAEEMERGVRAKETEAVEVEYDAYRENVENIVATSDDAKEDVEVHGSPDNVTSADVANTETITDTKTKDNSHLLRFAILFAMVMQVIIAILILAPQRDKLVEWCTRKKRIDSGPSETEPLQVGEKVFATGPTSKVLKVTSQRRPDVADANQLARV